MKFGNEQSEKNLQISKLHACLWYERKNQDIIIMQTKHFVDMHIHINKCVYSPSWAPVNKINQPTKWSWYWTFLCPFIRRHIFRATFNICGTAVDPPWYGFSIPSIAKLCGICNTTTAYEYPKKKKHGETAVARVFGS